MGLKVGSLFKKIAKIGAPIAGAALGPAGLMIGGGISAGLSGNDAARAAAEDQRLLGQFKVDTEQAGLGRRGSLLGALFSRLAAHPELYGKVIAPDMWGYLPGEGRGLTRESFELPRFPKISGGAQNDWLAGLMGGVGGLTGFLANKAAADQDVAGRVESSAASAIGATPSSPFGSGSAVPSFGALVQKNPFGLRR